MRRVGYVARMGGIRNEYTTLDGKLCTVETPKRRWEDNIKINFMSINKA